MPWASLFHLLKEDRKCAMCKKIRNTWHVIDRLVSQALLNLFALDHHLKEHSAMLSDSLKWGCFDRQNQLPLTITVCRCNDLYCSFRQQDRQCSVKLSFLFSLIQSPHCQPAVSIPKPLLPHNLAIIIFVLQRTCSSDTFHCCLQLHL